MTDISHIHPRHEAIDRRLTEWARWVRVRPSGWFTQPMFRMFQSKARQWEENPHIPVAINGLAALEIERAVSQLPEKHRTAVRWAYVFPWMPVKKIMRELAVSGDGLSDLIDGGRDMVKNIAKVS